MSKPEKPNPQATALRAEQLLRSSGARVTPARIQVLATLLDAPRALTHHDVQESLHDMDRVTLYRTLDFLTGAGLAHKIAADDRVFRYSAGADHAHGSHHDGAAHQHGHFKCTRCSKVFCLDTSGEAELLRDALQESLGRGFQSHDIEFTIKGWCADCAH